MFSTPYKAFSGQIEAELIEAFRGMTARLAPLPATIGPNAGVLAGDYRDSAVSFFPEGHWIQGIFYHFAAMANATTWRFDITGPSPVQYTVYDNGQFYDWHVDAGGEPPQARLVRKVTVIIPLDSADSYEGGTLQIKLDAETERARVLEVPEARVAGNVIVFQSYLPHRVTPVTSGRRRSLVCWIVGPPFR